MMNSRGVEILIHYISPRHPSLDRHGLAMNNLLTKFSVTDETETGSDFFS